MSGVQALGISVPLTRTSTVEAPDASVVDSKAMEVISVRGKVFMMSCPMVMSEPVRKTGHPFRMGQNVRHG